MYLSRYVYLYIGRPDEFVKKIAQNAAHPMLFVKIKSYLYNGEKVAIELFNFKSCYIHICTLENVGNVFLVYNVTLEPIFVHPHVAKLRPSCSNETFQATFSAFACL
jgi:hypothetical protein